MKRIDKKNSEAIERRSMNSDRWRALQGIMRWRCLIPVGALVLVLIWVGGIHLDTYRQVSEPGRVPILMYHTITEGSGEKSRYGIPLTEFEEQLEFLREMKIRSVLLEDVWKAQHGDTNLPANSIVITFDDGYANHYSRALPTLERYGFRGVFFVLSGSVGRDGYLTEDQVSDLACRGMSIQSHTHTHRLLDQLDDEQIEYELLESKEVLSRLTGCEVDFLCIPGGWYNQRVIEIAKATGFKAICSSDIGMNSPRDVQYVLRRLEVRGDMEIADFRRIFGVSRIARERTKRDFKLVVHRLLGPSRYVGLAHFFSGRMYYLWGGGISALVLAAGATILFYRRRSRLKKFPQ